MGPTEELSLPVKTPINTKSPKPDVNKYDNDINRISVNTNYQPIYDQEGNYIRTMKLGKGTTYVNPNKKIKTRRNRVVKYTS